MVKQYLFLSIIFLAFGALGQEADLSNEKVDSAKPSKKAVSSSEAVSRDLAELLLEIDPEAQGFRARNHNYQVQLDADPLVNGRLTLGFQLLLTDILSLTIPVSIDATGLGQAAGRWAGIYNPNIADHWSLTAGAGLKIRLSEWMNKASFYLEPMLQLGYYQQTVAFANDLTTRAIRIRPAIYVGWERVFDTGFVIGAKLGVEKPFDIALGNPLSYASIVSVVPMLSAGYAW